MNILFITNKSFLQNSNFGGAQCAKRNYDIISSVYKEENVKYIVMSDEIEVSGEDEKGITVKIQKSNVKKYLQLLFLRDCFSNHEKRRMVRYIKKINPDICFFDGSSFGNLGKYLPEKTQKIVFYHNIEKNYAWSRVKNTSLLCIVKFISFWINESYISKTADVRICLNERDQRLLWNHYKQKADFIMPISFSDVENKYVNLQHAPTNILIFVGSYFMPNIKGIRWFCKNVMPYVDKKLLIVGKKMEQLREELETSNIEVVGTVEHLEDYYHMADAVIMPIFVGDGMKVKTAEAMMYGKPIFATDEALEGYEVEGVKGIYRCNSGEEFISALKQQNAGGYVKEIRNLFLEKYSTKAVEEQFIEYLRKI